jgi:hypothetical protein
MYILCTAASGVVSDIRASKVAPNALTLNLTMDNFRVPDNITTGTHILNIYIYIYIYIFAFNALIFRSLKGITVILHPLIHRCNTV